MEKDSTFLSFFLGGILFFVYLCMRKNITTLNEKSVKQLNHKTKTYKTNHETNFFYNGAESVCHSVLVRTTDICY